MTNFVALLFQQNTCVVTDSYNGFKQNNAQKTPVKKQVSQLRRGEP